jgi:hypothetical protein
MPDNSVPRVRLLMAALLKDFDRKIKDPKIVRWVTLLAALVLLYDGIDSIVFDRIVGSDPLAWIDRTRAILVGTLLITFSISLFAVAWTGHPITAMSTGSATVGSSSPMPIALQLERLCLVCSSYARSCTWTVGTSPA